MAWKNTIPGEESQIVFGDKPYGNYWQQISDESARAIIAANTPTSVVPTPAPVLSLADQIISASPTDKARIKTALGIP